MLFRKLFPMDLEIRTQKIGSKWLGFIEGRPDVDETALSEEAARRKVARLREQLGNCGSRTVLFGGRVCELVKGHIAPSGNRLEHRNAGVVWTDLTPDDGGDDAVEPLHLEREPRRTNSAVTRKRSRRTA